MKPINWRLKEKKNIILLFTFYLTEPSDVCGRWKGLKHVLAIFLANVMSILWMLIRESERLEFNFNHSMFTSLFVLLNLFWNIFGVVNAVDFFIQLTLPLPCSCWDIVAFQFLVRPVDFSTQWCCDHRSPRLWRLQDVGLVPLISLIVIVPSWIWKWNGNFWGIFLRKALSFPPFGLGPFGLPLGCTSGREYDPMKGYPTGKENKYVFMQLA